jgi:hypothetical protein
MYPLILTPLFTEMVTYMKVSRNLLTIVSIVRDTIANESIGSRQRM